MSETHNLERLSAEVLDVLVIGGGIVGAGVARDAAMRGLKVGLVEQSDFASGTSSRSSRLLHGGMRYLAQGRIGLVREASREKRIVGQIAPHLAQPLAFIFPARRGTSWTKWKLALGTKLYDLLCGMRNYGSSRTLSRDDTLALLPRLATDNLTGSVRYFDALTNDARLVIDTLRSAASHGAILCNYVRLQNAKSVDRLWECELLDIQSQQTVQVRAREVVNAAGPWSDLIPNAKTHLRLTKGVHLLIERSRLPIPDAVVMAEGDRILFAIPWGERVIVGTTDTDYEGPRESPRCDVSDIRYILDVVNRTFPQAVLVESDIVSTWAGLRPLVADPHGNPSDISRRHEIAMPHPGWWDVTGGKLTTYRLMAEEAVNGIAKYLGVSTPPCQTASQPLLANSGDELLSGILPPKISVASVKHFCDKEWSQHLDDVMIRRTSWRYYHRDHVEIAARVAQWMAECLGWSSDQVRAEIEHYHEIVERS